MTEKTISIVAMEKVVPRSVTIELGLHQLIAHATKALLQKYGILDEAPFIKDGKICCEEDQHTSHTYFTTTVLVENPTAYQLEVVELTRRFRELVFLK